ncbi:GH25 family lysozyme [Lentilactobacillus senioris]|uniref:GH25 family lysozyme n=1 Tax=Lentilactobacillus senioris TaxID=931534 RepID=UPI00227DB146|nr:GH25 family lysozyme [Lentilactobacillus senioris]MCY9806583.1 GH25 family lysozyme [Lentilactobacillus senioris]
MKKNKYVFGVIAAAMAFLFAQNAYAARMDMVDVSNHNGNMTTSEYLDMRNHYGVKAVNTKISEGSYYADPYAATNIANAQAAGLYINGYHFARYKTKSQAVAEGNYAAQVAKQAGLPVGAVLTADVEAAEQTYVNKATNNANNKAFIKTVEAYGYRGDVYTMGSWLGYRMDIANGKGWIANYPSSAAGLNYYSVRHSWQWSSTYHFRNSYGSFDVSQLYDNYYTGGQNPASNSEGNTANKPTKISYYSWNPRRVKATSGVSTYSDVNCKKKVAHWSKGTEFDVKRVVHVKGKVYRLQLTNGKYLSGWVSHFKNMYYVKSNLKQVKTLRTINLYKDQQRSKKLRSYGENTYFNVKSIVKTKSSLWEIKTTSGFYMTGNKDFVVKTK